METLDNLVNKLFWSEKPLTVAEHKAVMAYIPNKLEKWRTAFNLLCAATVIEVVSLPLLPTDSALVWIDGFAAFGTGAIAAAAHSEIRNYETYLGQRGELEKQILLTRLNQQEQTPEVTAAAYSRAQKSIFYNALGVPAIILAGAAAAYVINNVLLLFGALEFVAYLAIDMYSDIKFRNRLSGHMVVPTQT